MKNDLSQNNFVPIIFLSHWVWRSAFVTLHLSNCICNIEFVRSICQITLVTLHLSHCISCIAFVKLHLSHNICHIPILNLSHCICHTLFFISYLQQLIIHIWIVTLHLFGILHLLRICHIAFVTLHYKIRLTMTGVEFGLTLAIDLFLKKILIVNVGKGQQFRGTTLLDKFHIG